MKGITENPGAEKGRMAALRKMVLELRTEQGSDPAALSGYGGCAR